MTDAITAKVHAIITGDDEVLDCPACDGRIVRSGETLLRCDICEHEWSAEDVARRNRISA